MFGFFGAGKRKSKVKRSSGTGYGGAQGDKKRLLAGRKKAEKASVEDDKISIQFLQQAEKQLFQLNALMEKGVSRRCGSSLREGDKKKLCAMLADIFRNQIPTDWEKRNELYKAALGVSRILASNETLGKMLGDKNDQDAVLYWLLDFSQQAKQIVTRSSDIGWTMDDQSDLLLATQVCEVSEAALKVSGRAEMPKPEPDLCVITVAERYQSELGPLRFEIVESMKNHYYLKKVPTAPHINARKLFKELAAYSNALPVEYGSSCFCRVMNDRLDILRVLITGPDDTPYANGCFFFDVNLPSMYPQVAPKVHFLTTGGGKIRFNPNLYNCGRVCLSLLGTWQGPGWVSGQSTLLQVLVSIQSLILVPDPYYNEPGWDRDRGTKRGDTHSKAYNKKIREHTISAAIHSHLRSIWDNKNPYVEFQQIMIKHYLEKKSLIEKELWSWAKDDSNLTSNVSNVCELLAKLKERERSKSRQKHLVGTPVAVQKGAELNEPIVLDDSETEEVYTNQFHGVSAVVRKIPQLNEPIVLDDSDKREANEPQPPDLALKSNKMIEIDLTGENEEKKEQNLLDEAKKFGESNGDDVLIDMTGWI